MIPATNCRRNYWEETTMRKKLLLVMAVGAAITGTMVSQGTALAKTSSPQNMSSSKTTHTVEVVIDSKNPEKTVTEEFDMTTLTSIGPDDHNMWNTYKTTKPFKITNEFRHKIVTLPAGTVVSGLSDSNGNLKTVNNMSISTKKQKAIFSKLGYNKIISYPVEQENGIAKNKYLRNTAYSYNSREVIPTLPKKTVNAQYGARPAYINVTADNYFTYHALKRYGPDGMYGVNYAYTSASKIKKFIRTKSSLTYYLAKPMSGVTTKRVRVGKHYRYRVKLTIGKSFGMSEKYNGDPIGTGNTINNNGKPEFYF